MAGMEEPRDYDPLIRSQREAPTFNNAWLKHGETLTLMQRIGFTIFSLVFFLGGITFLALVLVDIRDGEVVGAVGWSLPRCSFSFQAFLVSGTFCDSNLKTDDYRNLFSAGSVEEQKKVYDAFSPKRALIRRLLGLASVGTRHLSAKEISCYKALALPHSLS
jgi:hypothetical protein